MKLSSRMTRSILVSLFFLAASISSHAIPVGFQIVLEATKVENSWDCNGLTVSHRFGCRQVGDRFEGSFVVDDSILAVDGINQTAPVEHFFLRIGTVVWAQDFFSDLSGFRNGITFSSAPGFVISGNTIDDLLGGVFGGGDLPFVDFTPTVDPHTFSARDTEGTHITGNMTIQPMPEPEIIGLFGAGLFGIGIARSNKAQMQRYMSEKRGSSPS